VSLEVGGSVSHATIVSLPTKPKKIPSLAQLLKDEEVADFFRFVYENNLRLAALELLEKRLGEQS